MSLSFSCANQEDQIEMAKDVVSFLTQAAEPEMEERKLDEKDVFQSLDLLYRRVEGNEGSYNEGDASTIVIVDQYVKNLCSGDWPTNGTNFGVLAH
ncbi:uncharacterized protein LOC107848134 isoform X3 [Capsicum annuum]|uniref:uncharacterized protein LOC107848134 isoform X3 n=1 Tax=Capsicum annuum TaxID=4072 RepID=UPI001FB0B580|nr:uncharacterized protein LOC107848134 isoform X3 [Capsicum annuum]